MPLTLHMLTSLDGFIAKRDQDANNPDLSWMEAAWGHYDRGVEMSMDILDTIDVYLLGSRTYELALELGWPYGDKPTIVVTGRPLPARPNVEFYGGDLPALAARLGQQNVWLVGGAQLCQSFLRLGLVDQLCLTVAPIVLGHGVPLFAGHEVRLNLKDVTAFKNGMLDLWYDVVRDPAADA